MDRNELVEKAARAIRSAYIKYCGSDNPVLDAEMAGMAGDVSEWHGEAEAALDAILPDVIEAVKKGSLPAGAEWFPDATGIQWQGEVYYPADYVLTRLDIQAIRTAALEEAARIGNSVLASSLQDGGEDYDTGFSDAVGAFVVAIRRAVGFYSIESAEPRFISLGQKKVAVLGDALKGGN